MQRNQTAYNRYGGRDKMSRDSEKVLKELQKFLDAHAEDTENEADVDALAERFFAEYNLKCKEQKESAPETADDYLDLAEQVTSKKKSVEYLHKALELEPDNLDARLQLILRTAEQPDERRLALQELLDAADKQMEKSGAFKEYAGEFWTAFETRPYMRVRYTYFDVLISCGMMRRAIDEGQRLLELCENDNLGVRYQLMHLYAYMEDEMHALALHKQFDSYEETQMLLPLAVLYYKLNQFDKAEDYIKRLAKANKDTKKFLRAAARDQLDDYIGEMSPYGYRPFTMEELLDELMHTSYLFNSVPYFFAWASKVLAAKTGAKMSAGKPKLLH
jgi:tetratricopeptide (TPR) repeat protein